MKITKLETIRLPEHPNTIWVQVHTSDGLVGLGPAADGTHTTAETVDIPSIFREAKRAAILMSRLARHRR